MSRSFPGANYLPELFDVIVQHLLQSIDGSSYLVVRRALLVVGFDPCPTHAPSFVDHVNGRVRDASYFLPRVSGIAQPVSIDGAVRRVRQQREGDFASPVGGDLLCKLSADRGFIKADRVYVDGFVRFQQEA